MSRARYYRRDGKPIDLLLWARLFENPTYKQVADTVLEDGTRISTVWLGIDHSFMETGPPIIFETMTFAPEVSTSEFNGKPFEYHEEWDSERYSTEAEAIIGHDRMVRKWKAVREQWKKLHPGEKVDVGKRKNHSYN